MTLYSFKLNSLTHAVVNANIYCCCISTSLLLLSFHLILSLILFFFYCEKMASLVDKLISEKFKASCASWVCRVCMVRKILAVLVQYVHTLLRSKCTSHAMYRWTWEQQWIIWLEEKSCDFFWHASRNLWFYLHFLTAFTHVGVSIQHFYGKSH